MKRLSPDILFESDHLSQDLGKKSVRGGIAAMIGQGVRFVVGLGGTVILARMLTPDDFGLFGMVLVVTGFVDMLKNAGLSMATISAPRISHDQISMLFWTNLLISGILGTCLFLGAPLVAMFYGRPELSGIAAALSFSFILSGLVIQHQALLYRHMMFGPLAAIQIIAQAANMSVSIALAALGCSYWALVAGAISMVMIATVLTFFYCPWVPGRPRRGSGAFGMLEFGGHLTVGNVVRYLSENMDKLLIGRFIGASPLGLYTKAFQLYTMPIRQIRDPISNLAMPALSAIRDQPDRYRKYYQRLLDLLGSLTIPVALYCVLEADFLIHVFLGPQWIESVRVFQILSVAALIHPVAGTRNLVLVSMGWSGRFLWFESVNSLLCLAAFMIGLPFGIEGVAAAYAIMNYLVLLPSLFYCFHRTPITVSLFATTLLSPLLLSLLAGAVALLVKHALVGNTLMGCAVSTSVFAGFYGGASLCRKSVRKTTRSIVNELLNLRERERESGNVHGECRRFVPRKNMRESTYV